ncbi:G-protein alpha subunit [Athelia psychrophila]|uniref:G-protein alpha subunit n=1 Tax=Athelia psychrophila TaxID=1759441 RepID=A0A166PR47_9AGAM|nr:G-protein alpha subunit [Fibularhizoctonia sp. CBS 109695]
MFNFPPQDVRMAQARSNAIDRQIEVDSCKFKKEVKVLLLGSSGESDMSTFMKQMKIDHQGGFNRDELMAYRMLTYHNLVDSAQAVILAMRKLGLDCEIPSNRACSFPYSAFSSMLPAAPLKKPSSGALSMYPLAPEPSGKGEGFVFDPKIASMIAQLWEDPIMARVMDHSSEFDLMDSAQYFLENAVRIAAPGYVPNESDVLRAREKSTGITEVLFNMGPSCIRMAGVSGLRWEHKKWIHCLEDATSIIFCTALSDYDQVPPEDQDTTRMVESLVLFDRIVNSPWFLRASIILILTEFEVFKAKLAKVPLEKYFPEYTGGPDPNKAAKYILWRFMLANRAQLSIYPHLMQEGDTMYVRLVFAAVKETILHNEIKDSKVLNPDTL